MPRFRGSHSDKNKMFVRNVDTKENLSEENLWKLYKKKYDNVLAKLIYYISLWSQGEIRLYRTRIIITTLIPTPAVRIACHKALGWSRQNQL